MGPFINAATTQVYLLLVWIKDWIEWKKYLEELISFLLTTTDTAVSCNTTLFILGYEHIHCDIPSLHIESVWPVAITPAAYSLLNIMVFWDVTL
jgi:hypothetical protein